MTRWQHLNADDHLRQIGKGDSYGRGDFYIAFLGTPSDSGLWQLQFGGHHLALINTYRDGALAGATPSFQGIDQARAGQLCSTCPVPPILGWRNPYLALEGVGEGAFRGIAEPVRQRGQRAACLAQGAHRQTDAPARQIGQR